MSLPIRVIHLVPKYIRSNDLIEDCVNQLDPVRFHSSRCYMNRQPEGFVSPAFSAVRFLGFEPGEINGFNPRIAFRLKQLLQEQRPAILHCHRHKSVLYGVLAVWLGRRTDTKIIVSVHSMRRSRTFFRRMTNRILFPRVSRILAVSDGVRQDVLRANPWLSENKVSVVHNGIDLEKFPLRNQVREKAGWPVIGTVGRLVQTKGQTYLLQAFSKIVQTYPEATLLIAGAGPLLEDLKQEAAGLGIDPCVRFLGFQNDISAFLQNIDLFVLPSLAEGLCLAVLEAMATGVPVVSTRVGGLPEIFDHAPYGRLVPSMNVQALHEAIMEFLSMGDESLRLLGIEARKRVEEAFTLQRMARDFEEIYLQETETKGSG